MSLVREPLSLPRPLAAGHPVYVLLETADDVEALAAAAGGADDVAVADDTARREALWRYREALNPAVNAAGVPHKLDVSVPIGAMPAFAAAAREAAPPCGDGGERWRPGTNSVKLAQHSREGGGQDGEHHRGHEHLDDGEAGVTFAALAFEGGRGARTRSPGGLRIPPASSR